MGLSVESRNDSMYSILNLEDYSEHPVLPQQHLQDQQGLRKSDVHTARKTFLAKGLSYRVIRGSAGLIGHGEGEQWTLTQFPHSLDVFEGFSPSLWSPVLESVEEFFQFLVGVQQIQRHTKSNQNVKPLHTRTVNGSSDNFVRDHSSRRR